MSQHPQNSHDVSIAIVGAGFSGICMGIKLLKAGYRNFTIHEAAGDIGGTWRDNTYPGCSCDIPSVQYHFSFEPVEWKEAYAGQTDILKYQHHCVDKYGLKPHIRLNSRVSSAVYNERTAMWHITTADGYNSTVQVLILAQGGLAIPSTPNLPVLESFPGTVFHSARWDDKLDLTNKRVALIGTGASAVQIAPCIQPLVEKLYIFQRTPNWIVSRFAFVRRSEWATTFLAALLIVSAAAVVATLVRLMLGRPAAVVAAVIVAAVAAPVVVGSTQVCLWIRRQASFWLNEVVIGLALTSNNQMCSREIARLAKANLMNHVPDPELRAKLTPTYPIGCKRVLLHDTYYQAIQQDNVEVITSAVKEVTVDGRIIAEDGSTVTNVDAVILATGFDVAASLQLSTISIKGAAGQNLNQTLANNPYGAYLGVAVAGFPNMFILLGPNSWLGHNSMLFMIECASNFIMKFITKLGTRRGKLCWWEVSESAQRRFSDEARARLQGSVWLSGGCNSWYLPAGNNSAGSSIAVASHVSKDCYGAIRDVAGAAQRDQNRRGISGTELSDGTTKRKAQRDNSRPLSQSYCVMWMGLCVEYWWRTLWLRQADWRCGVVPESLAHAVAEAPAGNVADVLKEIAG